VGELKRYKVSVDGVQETKWFGCDVWPAAEGYIMVHSGRSVLWSGVLGKYGTGVHILAGEDLLQFCETNQLSIINSFFKKRYCGMWTPSN